MSEAKRRCTMLHYFGSEAESALPDSAPDTPIIDLQHNTVSPHLQKQPPNKENITDSIEPTSSCETAAGNYNDNDIGLAVGQRLSVEDRIKYLNPWTPTYASEFPSSIRPISSHTQKVVLSVVSDCYHDISKIIHGWQ